MNDFDPSSWQPRQIIGEYAPWEPGLPEPSDLSGGLADSESEKAAKMLVTFYHSGGQMQVILPADIADEIAARWQVSEFVAINDPNGLRLTLRCSLFHAVAVQIA